VFAGWIATVRFGAPVARGAARPPLPQVSMDYEPQRPAGYTSVQIILHWVIVALVLFQIVFAEAMEEAYDAVRDGSTDPVPLLASLHIWVGVAILGLAGVRLATRLGYGAPPAPTGTSPLQARAAEAMHWLFYALLFLVPISGLLAWYVTPAAADLHGFAKPAFIILTLLHAGAALYHQFVLKDGVLRRMMVPRA
jgi:cytochrome b561